MTARGWWCLFVAGVMLIVGVLQQRTLLAVPGLALVLWIGWVWLFFRLRVTTLLRHLRLRREVADARGGLATLWAGRDYTVRVQLRLDRSGRLPYLRAVDVVPFGVRHLDGETTADGELRRDAPLELTYRIACPAPGVARFEGLRLELSDLQGFFAHVAFLRDPVVFRILPGVLAQRGGGPTVKRRNELPPPGIHHHRQPGSGSELLDLRDYVPGDPPRTIAWKVSARRDRLITKEFESEVPVRCTLFVDVSGSVRVASPVVAGADEEIAPLTFRPLDRLLDIAAGVIHAGVTVRDLTGLCLFDEHTFRIVRPERTANHRNRLLHLLGDAAALGPVAPRADPEELMPIAYALAQEVYPDLLAAEVNAMPAWLTWLVAFPVYTRHRRGWIDRLHRRNRMLLLWGTSLLPLALLVVNLVAVNLGWVPEWVRGTLGLLLVLGVPLLVLLTWCLFLLGLLVSGRPRRLARWRKRLAALFVVRSQESADPHGRLPLPGGLDALLEDDDLFSAHLQQFLTDHQVPCAVPLYDDQGRYLFAAPDKIAVLGEALLQAVARGRDNELFVLLADLLDLDDRLGRLLEAVRVALARHHQVVILCPWPGGVPLPGAPAADAEEGEGEGDDSLTVRVRRLDTERLHAAYGRIRRAFARLGVQVGCAADDASLPLVLARLERLRTARILREPGRS